MKQILQNLSNGETSVIEVPCPKVINGTVLIQTKNSVISAGTERMLINFGKAGWIEKARQQPDKVKQVLDKVKSDGLLPTIDAVFSKLDQPLPLGYCNAGVVLESMVPGFSIGDRVVSNGNHASVVRVFGNLCARIPDSVDDESAAFTVLAAIGLQGIRLANPTLGESVAVIGLGLVGLLVVQMLRANGCRVLGIDYNSDRCNLAKQFGAEIVDLSKNEDPVPAALQFSRGGGVDAVIITASTSSDLVMHQAAQICRKRGRIVLVGVVGLQLRRDDFFKKEITFQVSASYGPGRYDPSYEEGGCDYPIGFVRWTEQRNFEAVLDLMEKGVLNVKSLITHRFKIDDAVKAYKLLDEANVLGVVLEYPDATQGALKKSIVILNKGGLRKNATTQSIVEGGSIVGFIGAGNYASRTLIPAFKKTDALLDTLVTSGGVSGVHYGQKAGFAVAATDVTSIWENSRINTVVIATRHDTHARMVLEALKARKNIFVEKPLAITIDDLNAIDASYKNNIPGKLNPILMVGFNRRFSPHAIKMKELMVVRKGAKCIIITVNAGSIPSDHWTQDKFAGGGRIVGECCHFIDLIRFLIGSKITGRQVLKMEVGPGKSQSNDKVSIGLSFADGSIGTIHYFANGSKAFPKERIEVFSDGGILQLDNFRILRGYDWPDFRVMKLWRQDKGQFACVKAFVESLKSQLAPIPYEEIIESSRIAIEIAEEL